MKYLSQAIEWKYGACATLYGTEILEWHSDEKQPSPEEFDGLVKDYLAALPQIQAEKEQEKLSHESQKQAVIDKLGLSADDVELLKEILRD